MKHLFFLSHLLLIVRNQASPYLNRFHLSFYISSTAEILNGMPIIAGTRVPIACIIFFVKEGYTLEEIHEQFDHISLQLLEGALDEVAATFTTSHDRQIL